jgi:proteasome assembly chaperone (PAC2) family protein
VTSFEIDRLPELHNPIGITAFAGWNDAASAATNAARFITRRMGARRFATLDAEDFYSFTDTRPTVRSSPSGQRVVQWPTNEAFYARNPTGPHDLVVSIGTEPNLRWPTFAAAHSELFARLGVDTVISLGALLADVPHTRPVRVTGAAGDEEMSQRLNLQRSRYEGPTGIVGVMQQAMQQADLHTASLWANVPHYITAAQNPLATLALLERIQQIVEIGFDLSDLRDAGERFKREVSTALSANPEVTGYVQQLESAFDSGVADSPPLEMDTRAILSDIESYLREHREDEDDGDESDGEPPQAPGVS